MRQHFSLRPFPSGTSCILFLLFSACSGKNDTDSVGELPPEESRSSETGTPEFTIDTGITTGTADGVPEHTLTVRYTGFWILTPLGGPYKALTGELETTEILDGDEENPSCYLRYALTGTPESENCPGCSFTFLVTHYLAEGDPEACQQPELPKEQERQGFADPLIYQDYQQTGLWFAWYNATFEKDEVDINWETTLGVDVQEEDP